MDFASLLAPFVSAPVSPREQAQLSTYLDLLLRWNAKLNLTAVRDAESIVSRHIGESFFAADRLLPAAHLIDLGSGAGFPGIPMKIRGPQLRLTLIESQNKKATFLREVLRALELREAEVFAGRAESFSGTADLVTLRAVERFEKILPIAARLVAPRGRLALLIGEPQTSIAERLLPALRWEKPIAVPQSRARVIFVGTNLAGYESRA